MAGPGVLCGGLSRVSKPSLLVISTEQALSEETCKRIHETLAPRAKEAGMLMAVLSDGLKAEVHRDLSPLVEALQAQTHAIQSLVEQNAAMFQSMVEKEAEEEGEPVGYLSLKRR